MKRYFRSIGASCRLLGGPAVRGGFLNFENCSRAFKLLKLLNDPSFRAVAEAVVAECAANPILRFLFSFSGKQIAGLHDLFGPGTV